MDVLGGALARSAHFIAWGNFVDPGVLWLWLRSLLLLTLVSVVAWTAGSQACRALRFRSPAEELVLSLATGLGVLGLVATGLALVHLYVLWAAALVAAAVILSAPSAAARFPGVVVSVVRDAPVAAAFAWVCSLGALLPPYRWDEVSYHLAYPQQWVAVGHLTIDPHLAYPLYTLTWQALLGVALMLGSPSLAHLLTWLCGVVTAWTIALFLDRLGVASPTVRVARMAFLVTPLIQSILNVALVDLPIMCFFTVSVYALFALQGADVKRPAQVAPAAVCAATLVSLKITAILFAPLLISCAAYRFRGRALAIYVVLFGLLGSVWYVRNTAVTGDPLTPLLAPMLGRTAPYWSRADMAAQAADLRRGLSYSPADLAVLPLRVVTSTDEGPLRGPPALGYALLFPFTLLLVRRLARAHALDVLVAAWYAGAAWVATTYLIRYAYWIPLAIVCAAVLVDAITRWRSRAATWWRWGVPAALLIGPTLSGPRYIKNTFRDRIATDPAARRAFAFGGCADDCSFGALVRAGAPGARVYNVSPPMTYYLQEAGFRVVNGAFHLGGLLTFVPAFESGNTMAFLRSARADYLVIDDRYAGRLLGLPADSVGARARASMGPPVYADSVSAVYRVAAMTAQR
jgi:hypothetical protein